MRRRFAQLAWIVLGFNLLVVLWGAVVRASQSGEGCGDHWPLCNGSIIPHGAQIQTLIEFAHRASVPIASVLVVAMAVWAFRSFRRELVWKAAAASFLLLITEALLGAGLVLFKYTGADVSVGRIAYLSAHLINTHMLLAAIAVTAWWAVNPGRPDWSRPAAVPLKTAIAIALAIGVTGSITALSDTVFPARSLAEGLAADFSGASPVLIRLRVLHPILAIIGGLYTAAVAVRFGRGRGLATVIVTLVVLQLGAGIVNLYLLAPIWMQLVHLLLADLLWIAVVLFTAAVLEKSELRRPASELVHR